MIVKALLFGFAIFFFVRMRQEKKKAVKLQKGFDELTKEKSKLSNSVREKGIAVDRLEKMNKDLQYELEETHHK